MSKKLINIFSHIFFPPYCEWCRTLLAQPDILCARCIRLIQPVVSYKLSLTEAKHIWVYALGTYKDPLKYLILSKSWSYRLASFQLGELLWNYAGVSLLAFDLIIPVPLHWTRFGWRGYNQAESIAQVISHKSQKPYINALQRIRRTSFQSELPKTERLKNIQKVFKVNERYKEVIQGKRILLVDDLMTTGTTLSESAKVLFYCKPSAITGLVVCRVT